MKVDEFYHKTEKEIRLIFNKFTSDDLKNFLKDNNIPFRKSMTRKQLLKHTIEQILSYGLYYRIGNN